MSKYWLGISVALLAVFSWLFWPDSFAGGSQPDSAGEVPRLSSGSANGQRVAEQRESAEQRQAVAADSVVQPRPLSTGSLRVRVLFSDGVTPAGGIRLVVRSRSNADRWHGFARLRTDGNGEARVSGIEAGPCRVDTDRENPFWHPVEIEVGRESHMTIVMKKGLDVTGIVVSREGTPVPGAKIMLEHVALPWRKIEPVATSGADGRFTVRDIRCPGSISAVARSYAPSMGSRLRTLQGTTELRLVLGGAAGLVTGRVEDTKGDAVAGALVRIGIDDGARIMHQTTGRGGSPGMGPISVEVFTDEDGQFRAESVAPGSVAIGVRAAGFAPFRGTCDVVALAGTTKIVRLVVGAVCIGTVRDSAGAPLADVEVMSGQPNTIGELRTRTNDEGTYRLAGLPAGEIEIFAVGKDKSLVKKVLHLRDEELVEWNPTFSTGTPLRGRVLTGRGDPVVNGIIEVSASMKDSPWRRFVGRTRTDHEGRFRVPRCPERVTVYFRGKEYKGTRRSEVDPRAGELIFRVRKLEFNASIKGRVIGPSGEPIGGARVTCGSQKVRTESDGVFTFGAMSAGSRSTYSVRIMAKGYAEYRTDWRELTAHETWDLGTVRVVPGGCAEVTFDRSVVGTPVRITMTVSDASLRVHTASLALSDVAHTPDVAPGRYRLELRGKGIASQLIPFEVAEGGLTKLKVTLARGSRCDLRLVTDEKTWVRVTINDERGVVVVDKRAIRIGGQLVLRSYLAPGRYTAKARTVSGKRCKVEFAVPDGQPVVIDFPVR